MSTSEISLTNLLDEQAISSNQFVIEGVPDNSDYVKVSLLTPGMRLSCKGGVVLPASAIKSIKKTGDTVSCCGKALHAVELTFSYEKMVSYDELFSIVKDVHSSATTALAQSIQQSSAKRDLLTNERPRAISRAAGGDWGSCMVEGLVRGPSGPHFAVWFDTWANICDALYP